MAAMAKKTCFKCKETKSMREFYKHPDTDDGHLGKCKSCTKRDMILRYYERSEIVTAYEKRRQQTDHRKAKTRGYKLKDEQNNPGRVRARVLVQRALRDGRLIKTPCEVCGEKVKRVYGHHDDYRKPLSVRWLCGKHHRREHLKNPTPLPKGV